MSVPFAVTVSGHPDEALRAQARGLADALGVPFLDRRGGFPVHKMLGKDAQTLLVLQRDGVALWDAHDHFRWSPGMAALRLIALSRGEPDNLVGAAQLRSGESVLDCTLGLGQDALVAARAVGPSGRVLGVEKSLHLYAVVRAGLERLGVQPESCEVEVRRGDAGEVLASLPDGAFDCVLFDPMFGKPKKAQPVFEFLRRYADHSPLTPELLTQARRVARRAVVVKGARYSDDLVKLGLRPLPTSRFSELIWARVDACGG